MSTPTFPQEIVDTIIDCAWDLQREFKPWRVNAGAHRVDGQEPFNVFALVSRSWVARARHCAFRDLTFRRKWSPDARQFTGAVLEHALCTIREHVLHLDFDTDTDTSRTVRCQTAHFSYIANFPNLRSLGLYDLVFEAHLWDSSILESMLLPALENLKVKSCTFPREACLVELLACATGLRSLRCWYISVHAIEPIPSVYSGPQHLTELSITVTHHPCRQFLEWMSSASVPPRIANLELQGIDSESVASVSRVLQVLGSSVVTLSLLMRSLERTQAPFHAEADLSTLRNIQHLVTGCSFFPWGERGVHVQPMLAQLAEHCKKVQSITFYIHGPSSAKEDILTMPWEAIIAILNGPSFRQLDRIVIQLPLWRDELCATRDMLNKTISQQLLGNVTLVCQSDGDWSF